MRKYRRLKLCTGRFYCSGANMPEAFAILFVVTLVIGGLCYAALVPDPEKKNRKARLERLGHHIAWLRERIEKAERERWETRMIAELRAQLAEEERQWAREREESPARAHTQETK